MVCEVQILELNGGDKGIRLEIIYIPMYTQIYECCSILVTALSERMPN